MAADNPNPWDYCEQCSDELDHAILDLRTCNDAKKVAAWYQEPEVVAVMILISVGVGYQFGKTMNEPKGLAIGF